MDKDFADMMNRFSDMIGNRNMQNNNDVHDNPFNVDINTLLKLKSVMDKVGSKSDPRSNLLKSLKPYLNENKQAKIDQYINLFSMSKVMEILKNTGGDKNNG